MTPRTLVDAFYPETSFGGFSRVDGTIAFYQRVNALLAPSSVVLDVGCGRGEYADDQVVSRRELRCLRGKCAAVIGIDRDSTAISNTCIDEFRTISGGHWPLGSETVDLCLIDNVVEHVADPDRFFDECFRVLRPGGFVCVRTPNSLGYATVMARLVPNFAHSAVLARVQRTRQAVDIFPTLYRCNSPRRLRRTLLRHGFKGIVFGHWPEPAYLGFSTFAFALGAAWAALAPSVLQGTLFAFARRP